MQQYLCLSATITIIVSENFIIIEDFWDCLMRENVIRSLLLIQSFSESPSELKYSTFLLIISIWIIVCPSFWNKLLCNLQYGHLLSLISQWEAGQFDYVWCQQLGNNSALFVELLYKRAITITLYDLQLVIVVVLGLNEYCMYYIFISRFAFWLLT